MSAAGPPPPYPGDEKGGQGYGAPYPPQQGGYPPSYPPTSQPEPYPPTSQVSGYPPSQAGYPPTSQAGGYPPPQAGYPLPPHGDSKYPPHTSYPPPQGYIPHEQQHSTVVVTQPGVAVIQSIGPLPARTVCPHCRADIVTATHFESGTLSFILCVVLCFIGCDLGCCLIPFCMEGCQDVVHTCPSCNQHISRWRRI